MVNDAGPFALRSWGRLWRDPDFAPFSAKFDTQASRELGVLLGVAKDNGWISIPFDLDVAATWWFGMMNGRFMVEGDGSSLIRREWDAIAIASVMFLLFGNYDETP